MNRLLLCFLAASVICACATTQTAQRTVAKQTVLFLCPYGGAKSLIATSYFNRLVQQQGLPYVGVAAATDEPYIEVPARVADFLEGEGFPVRAFKPRRMVTSDATHAMKIVSIDADLARLDAAAASATERWDDVPKVSVDLDASVAAIRKHVEALAAQLRAAQ